MRFSYENQKPWIQKFKLSADGIKSKFSFPEIFMLITHFILIVRLNPLNAFKGIAFAF